MGPYLKNDVSATATLVRPNNDVSANVPKNDVSVTLPKNNVSATYLLLTYPDPT